MTLKANSKKILDIIASQPGINQTDAYRQVHPSAGDNTARANAYKLMQKPEAQIYLQKHIEKAKETIVSLLDSEKDEIRLKSADSILDRSLGKATQRLEVQKEQVSITIDLTKSQEPTGVDNVVQ
jgi:hypothetical protein